MSHNSFFLWFFFLYLMQHSDQIPSPIKQEKILLPLPISSSVYINQSLKLQMHKYSSYAEVGKNNFCLCLHSSENGLKIQQKTVPPKTLQNAVMDIFCSCFKFVHSTLISHSICFDYTTASVRKLVWRILGWVLQ